MAAYLLSDRFGDHHQFEQFLEKLPQAWAGGAEAGRLTIELAKFRANPRHVSLTINSDKIVPAQKFFEALDHPIQGSGQMARLSFSDQ